MKHSESIKNLAAALHKAQADMGGAVKDAANPFFKSSYADLTSVIKAIKQPFADNGLSFVQMPVSVENTVGVNTILMHESGEWLESSYFLPMVKFDPQAAGSAITYARRYALQSMAGLPAVDDDSESAMLRGGEATLPDGVPTQQAAPAKRVNKELVQGVVQVIVGAMSSGETSEVEEALSELLPHEKEVVWGQLSTKQKAFVRELKTKEI